MQCIYFVMFMTLLSPAHYFVPRAITTKNVNKKLKQFSRNLLLYHVFALDTRYYIIAQVQCN